MTVVEHAWPGPRLSGHGGVSERVTGHKCRVVLMRMGAQTQTFQSIKAMFSIVTMVHTIQTIVPSNALKMIVGLT